MNKEMHTLLVTSPDSSEGKSIIVANLAVALAKTGLRVILVDADLRLPRLHKIFDLEQGEGLTGSLLKGNFNGNLETTKQSVMVLTSGDVGADPAEVISSPALPKLIEKLKAKADIVLIDCPPVLAVADTTILSTMVDGVLLVLRSGHTTTRAAAEALDSLKHGNARILGAIFNDVADHREGYHRYYGKAAAEPNNIRTTGKKFAKSAQHFFVNTANQMRTFSEHTWKKFRKSESLKNQ